MAELKPIIETVDEANCYNCIYSREHEDETYVVCTQDGPKLSPDGVQTLMPSMDGGMSCGKGVWLLKETWCGTIEAVYEEFMPKISELAADLKKISKEQKKVKKSKK